MEIKKQIQGPKTITAGFQCDQCASEQVSEDIPEGWHMFNVSLDRPGHDPVDNIQWYHVCSPECYIKKVGHLVAHLNDHVDEFEIDEMDRRFVNKLIHYVNF